MLSGQKHSRQGLPFPLRSQSSLNASFQSSTGGNNASLLDVNQSFQSTTDDRLQHVVEGAGEDMNISHTRSVAGKDEQDSLLMSELVLSPEKGSKSSMGAALAPDSTSRASRTTTSSQNSNFSRPAILRSSASVTSSQRRRKGQSSSGASLIDEITERKKRLEMASPMAIDRTNYPAPVDVAEDR